MGFSRVQASDGQSLQNLADTLVSAKKVVMITGAGISTSCGIPDFRSQEGLYSLIKDAHGNTDPAAVGTKGKDLFDSNLWRDGASTQTFYKFISSLRRTIADDVKKASLTHKFIAKLKEQRKLVRCYTQNIDGLETREGLSMELLQGKGSQQRFGRKAMGEATSGASAEKGGMHHAGCEVVPLHGDLRQLRCTVCSHNTAWTEDRQAVMSRGEAPPCPECEEKDMIRTAMGRRGLKVGALRPDIVLYGENHPNTDAIAKITEADLKLKPDVLLVMGTSLKVHGLKRLVREFAKAVHDKKGGKVIFVNLTEPAESTWKDVFDHWVDMDCDGWVRDMKQRRKELWMAQAQLQSQITKTAITSETNSHPKVKGVGRDQENDKAYVGAVGKRQPPPPQVIVPRSLKRTASQSDLPAPATPKRRKPLQFVTPSSSRRGTKSRTVRDKDALFTRLENIVTPKVPSTSKTLENTPPAGVSQVSGSLPTPKASQSTPSRRRGNPRIQASLNRINAPLLTSDDIQLLTPESTRQTKTFNIFEDSQIVSESEKETNALQTSAQKTPVQRIVKLAWWQNDDKEDIGETIELLSSPAMHNSEPDSRTRRVRAASTGRKRQTRSRSVGHKVHAAVAGRGVINGKVQTGIRRGSPVPPNVAVVD